MPKEYNASSLRVLEGLDAVRMRPGMFIGSTGPRGLHHLIWELVDNAIDEAANGFARKISVQLYRDGSASVEDDGRGVPADIHPQLGISGIELVYTKLHAGGKFDHENYQFSGGLHGVGASVVNALSRWMTVDSYTNGAHYQMRFESQYDDKEKKIVSGKPVTELLRLGSTRRHGTRVVFMPDDRVFEETVFNAETIRKRLRELAYLNKGIEISFVDERESNPDLQTVTYCYLGGLQDYVRSINQEKAPAYDKIVFFEGTQDGVKINLAFQHTDSYSESIFSFVNSIATAEGGTHEMGFKSGFTRALNDFARRNSILKDKDGNLAGEDYREGLTAVLSIYVKDPQFEGQTKGKLGNTEVRPAVESFIYEKMTAFLDNLSNRDVAQSIMEKGLKASKVREAAKKAKEIARAKNQLEATPLVGKLSSCTGRKPQENEMFIVEGDSAGGSAKQGRDRRFQAILPIRGKPLNVEKKRIDQVLANDEFRSIITALGTGIGEDFDIRKIQLCITGGEPLLRKDFFEILGYAHSLGYRWGMTSNATLIDRDTAHRLALTGMRTISVSIDGLEETHDRLRGMKGGYRRAMEGIRNLIDEDAFESVQVTTVVNHGNIGELDELFEIMDGLDIDSWRVIHLEPIGRALLRPEMMLTKEDYIRLFDFIREKRRQGYPLEFGCSHYLGPEYEAEVREWYWLCNAGVYTASIMANGDIGACLDIERRPETIQGNIYKDRFSDVWYNRFGIFRRDFSRENQKCRECGHAGFCRGDARHSWDYDNMRPMVCMKDILF